jgi:hypothetical protein
MKQPAQDLTDTGTDTETVPSNTSIDLFQQKLCFAKIGLCSVRIGRYTLCVENSARSEYNYAIKEMAMTVLQYTPACINIH